MTGFSRRKWLNLTGISFLGLLITGVGVNAQLPQRPSGRHPWPEPKGAVRPKVILTHEAAPVTLFRQQIFVGPIPYVGQFPAYGSPPKGYVTSIDNTTGRYTLRFLKQGRSSQECDNPDAVVVLRPGGCLMGADLAAVYGTNTPYLPVVFVACIQEPAQAPDLVVIRVQYNLFTP
jgi:hypothetical protein